MKPYKNQPKFAQEGLHGVIDDLLFQPDLDKKNTAELTALPMAKVPGSILKALKPHHTDYIRVDPIEARYWHIGIHPHDDRQVFYVVGNKAERVKTLNYGNIKQIYAFIKKSALTTQIEADTLLGGKKAFSGGGSHGQSAAGLGTSTKKNSYFKNEGAGLDSDRGPSASQSSKRKNYPGNKKTIGKPNNSMQPVDTVAPSVIINQPKPKQVIKLEQNQATKRRFAYHQLGPGETAASVVERYTGTPNENRIYGFNYPQFTAKNPPQAGDEVRVSTGFDVLVKGQFYNSNKVFVMWNGPTTGSKTATLEQVNGEYQQDRGYDWELVLPLVGGEYTLTAEAGGVTDSVSFTVDASVERMMSANNRNQQIDTNAQFAADEARWASRQQGVVDRANGLSASLSSQARALESRYRNQIVGIQASADAAFAKGVARGDAMYAAGVRNREVTSVDLLKGVDVEGNIAWGQQQRNKFNQFYKELNPVQKYAFDKAVAVGRTASDIVFGPTRAPNAIETELNLFGNVPLVEVGGGVSLTVDSYGRFSLAGGGTLTVTSDVGLNIGAALGQVKGYGTTSSALGGGEAISTTADVSITELAVDKDSFVGKLLKARPADLFAGYESGYTQKGQVWSQQGSEDQYYFEGGYVGGSVGNDGIYKFDTTTVKNLGFDKFIVGRTYEKAWAVESSPNILGRVAYNILDIFHD